MFSLFGLMRCSYFYVIFVFWFWQMYPLLQQMICTSILSLNSFLEYYQISECNHNGRLDCRNLKMELSNFSKLIFVSKIINSVFPWLMYAANNCVYLLWWFFKTLRMFTDMLWRDAMVAEIIFHMNQISYWADRLGLNRRTQLKVVRYKKI